MVPLAMSDGLSAGASAGFEGRKPRARRTAVAAVAIAAVALGVAGCSSNKAPTAQAVDPNLLPTNYRVQIAQFLRQSLNDRSDFRGAQIGQLVLKPFGTSPHYIACVQFSARSQINTKVALFIEGQIAQFIDATPELCSDAAYQPFTELASYAPGL